MVCFRCIMSGKNVEVGNFKSDEKQTDKMPSGVATPPPFQWVPYLIQLSSNHAIPRRRIFQSAYHHPFATVLGMVICSDFAHRSVNIRRNRFSECWEPSPSSLNCAFGKQIPTQHHLPVYCMGNPLSDLWLLSYIDCMMYISGPLCLNTGAFQEIH